VLLLGQSVLGNPGAEEALEMGPGFRAGLLDGGFEGSQAGAPGRKERSAHSPVYILDILDTSVIL
jgi:hypothetical protein